MKVRYGAYDRDTRVGTQIGPHDVTILHLGRGGVKEDGTLDRYSRERVQHTLDVAQGIRTSRPRATIRIIWTGGHNRAQDRSGTERAASEGGAALDYAETQLDPNPKPNPDPDDKPSFIMQAEEDSTSTVENATACTELVRPGTVIVVVTDPLHYLAGKVQFIMWLVFPWRKVIFVELPGTPPGTTWKSRAKHLASTLVTVLGMTGVKRGDGAAIQKRQERLQRLLHH